MKAGLLGWPVEHSVSPAMHNAAFAACGISGRYDLLPAHPAALAKRVETLLAEGYEGFNVTVPHKKAVLALPQVATRSEAVKTIGAANTLIQREDQLHAENTDWLGLRDDLNAHGFAGRDCLILGTGGSAQAAAYTLTHMSAERIRFVSRTPQEADEIGYEALSGVTADLVLNCTPVGMAPHTEASPWPEGIPLPEGAAIYDLIYNPPVTRLLRTAEKSGHPTANGLGMLVRQGAFAFAAWTGVQPPLDIMTRAAQAALQ